MKNAVTIIGIDPGSVKTGYGVILADKRQAHYITAGVVKTAGEAFNIRLRIIYEALKEVVAQHQPQTAAVENLFMHKNASSALKLGQARGAAITALGTLPISEYTPREVKQSVVGYGNADKMQMQYMVKTLLKITDALSEDAADALAIALCHQRALTATSLLNKDLT